MNTSASLPAAVPTDSTEDKTVAIVSYLTLIGFIIALVLHSSKKTQLGAYHLRQTLGLMLTSVAGSIVLGMIPVLGWLASIVLFFAVVALWFIGLLSAIKGEMKPLPVLGKHFEKWFANAFV